METWLDRRGTERDPEECVFLTALSLVEERQGWDRGQVGDLSLPLHLGLSLDTC